MLEHVKRPASFTLQINQVKNKWKMEDIFQEKNKTIISHQFITIFPLNMQFNGYCIIYLHFYTTYIVLYRNHQIEEKNHKAQNIVER